MDALRQFFKKYRFSIAFTLSVTLHFLAFFVCPHLSQKETFKGETLLTYEVALLEPSICVSKDVSQSSISQEASTIPEILPVSLNEDLSISNDKVPESITDVQSIDEKSLPQKIEPKKIEPPQKKLFMVKKKPIQPFVKPKRDIKKMPQKEVSKEIEKKEIDPVKNELTDSAQIYSAGSEISQGNKGTQQVSEGNDQEAFIMPIEKATLRGKLIMPKYPKRAEDIGLEGEVTLHIFIDKSSQVKDIKVIHYKGSALFCDAAIKIIREKWGGLIEPHKQNGQFIGGWVEITIPFTIERE